MNVSTSTDGSFIVAMKIDTSPAGPNCFELLTVNFYNGVHLI